jgi:hypothetical protein
MLSVLSKLLSTLLVFTLTGTVFSTVVNQTVLNSHYIEGKLTQTNSYERLSTALSEQVSQKVAAGSENPLVARELKSILSPETLRTKINSTLDQLQAYYEGKGPLPTIDLTDLGAQAQAAGIPLPSDSNISKPITLDGIPRTKGQGHNLKNSQYTLLITTLVLAAALALVCRQRHKWVAFPGVLLASGILIGLLAVLAAAASGAITQAIPFNAENAALATIGRDLASSIMTDVARHLGFMAALCELLSVMARILIKRLGAPAAAKPATKQTPPMSPIIR